MYDYQLEIIHDFRVIYNTSVYDVGRKVPFIEGYYLLLGLMNKPESKLATKIHNWERTFSWEEVAVIQNSNLTISLNTEKNKTPNLIPYPFEPEKKKNRIMGSTVIPLERARTVYVNERKDYTAEEAAELNRIFLEQQKVENNGG